MRVAFCGVLGIAVWSPHFGTDDTANSHASGDSHLLPDRRRRFRRFEGGEVYCSRITGNNNAHDAIQYVLCHVRFSAKRTKEENAMHYAKKKIVYIKLSKLKPHPRQGKVFPDLPEPQFLALLESMRKNGLIHPIEILPDGTIIAGHQRVRAAKVLGWTTIACWVRYDLAEADPAAVERRLIEDNFNRRQLGRLAMARCYRRLKELDVGPERNRNGKGDLRDFLGKQFGMAGRSLDRYEKILDAPLEVQRAFESQKLSLILAGKVADLPGGIQKQIAEDIRSGKRPTIVVKGFLTNDGKPAKRLGTALSHFVKAVGQGVGELRGRIDKADLGNWQSDLPTLRQGREVIDRLIRRIEKSVPDAESIAQFMRRRTQ